MRSFFGPGKRCRFALAFCSIAFRVREGIAIEVEIANGLKKDLTGPVIAFEGALTTVTIAVSTVTCH